ncbi:MAG: ABC transporter permease subunit [Dehalococcoidales bacterium]|nr:MAG: ABC transporter permease subunit [Dehalococcoidales bacterium]
MKNTMLIARREFRSYLTSPMAYIVACVFLALVGALFIWYLNDIDYSDTTIVGYLDIWGNLVLMLFAAALAMRLIAEEKKLGTWELLLTAPLRDSEVVLGKFLGSLGMLVSMLVLTLYFPLILLAFGDPDIGPIITGYIGLFLLGAASLSIGLFASSVTSNQIVAAVIAGGMLAILYFIGMAGDAIGGAAGNILSYISLSSHFQAFIGGIIDTRAVIYYLSVTAMFLFLTTRSIETGRWS